MSPDQKRAVIYARISRDIDQTGLGVARQIEDCQELCATNGWRVGEVLQDNDISAYTGKPRPGYQTLVDGLSGFDVLVAWHPDRLTRNPTELEALIDAVERAGVQIATVTAGAYDLGTATGRMSARIVGAVARHESEHKSQRIRRKTRELAEAGKVYGGGIRPYGYEADKITINPVEAAEINKMVDRVLEGHGLRSIVAELNDRAVPTAGKATAWTRNVVRGMLIRPRIAGLRAHKGTVVAEAEWPPIVDRDRWERCKAILEDPERDTHPGAGHWYRYLLTGGVGVDSFDRPLLARPNKQKQPCYITIPDQAGPGTRILAKPTEQLVVDAMLERLGGFDLAEFITQHDDTRPAQIEANIKHLAARLGAGDIDIDEFSRQQRTLDDERHAAIDKAASTRLSVELRNLTRRGRLADVWPHLEVPDRKHIIAAIINKVVIAPAIRGRNRFDPDRITIQWRA